MLAVQQAPRMGSSQPPLDPFLPFGYAVDPNQEPLLDPPEPAPGAPLLSENDSRLLSSFFDDMTADHYNMPTYGEGLNFSDTWLDLPPQFMGTTTSFGQQPGSSMPPPAANGLPHNPADFHSLHMAPNAMPPPPPPPPPQSLSDHRRASDDVLNAAATLLHNGPHIQRHNSTGSDSSSFARRPVGPPVGHLRHQPLEEFKEEGRRGVSAGDHDNMFTDWMFGSRERPNPRHGPPPDMQWGSDSSFNHIQGFTPNSDKETSEAMSKEQLKYLDCFEPSQSRDTTRPSSPINGQVAPPASSGSEFVKSQQDAGARPRKRRKSKNNKEVVEDDSDRSPAVVRTVRKKKGKSETAAAPPVEEAGTGKRRKSGLNASKAARENLSEEQKRENHIKSEQKRRTLIKEGFGGLCDLVPGLRGGGFSKSAMLTMAADWLDELLQGNEVLNQQLSSLERR